MEQQSKSDHQIFKSFMHACLNCNHSACTNDLHKDPLDELFVKVEKTEDVISLLLFFLLYFLENYKLYMHFYISNDCSTTEDVFFWFGATCNKWLVSYNSKLTLCSLSNLLFCVCFKCNTKAMGTCYMYFTTHRITSIYQGCFFLKGAKQFQSISYGPIHPLLSHNWCAGMHDTKLRMPTTVLHTLYQTTPLLL